MYKLKLKTHFAAAHQLKNSYSKQCHSLHGHNWLVKIEIAVPILTNGMVIDFKKVKEIVDEFDHKNLNEVILEEPTAENLARIIWEKINDEFRDKVADIVVEIEESEGASITYSIDRSTL